MTGQQRLERNRRAAERLSRPGRIPLPRPVLVHALRCTWVPALPRRAVASYWAAHPVRADRLARVLAARSGAPPGWAWHVAGRGAASFRVPPAPYREAPFDRGAGACCICGQPVYRFGWHRDLWGCGTPNKRARWHAACVAAWQVWTAPDAQRRMLGRLQGRRCALTGERLLRSAEADHRVPLHQVWRDRDAIGWPALLGYWGFPNLQAVNAAAHRAKSAAETTARARLRRGPAFGETPPTDPMLDSRP